MQIIKCDRCNKEMNPIEVMLIPQHRFVNSEEKNYELCKDCADKQIKFNIELDNYVKSAEERLKKDLNGNEKSPYIKLDKNMKHCSYNSNSMFIKEYYDWQQRDDDIKKILNKLEDYKNKYYIVMSEWNEETQQLKETIEKAKEYIKENRRADLVFKLYLNEDEVDNLLNILNGDDK